MARGGGEQKMSSRSGLGCTGVIGVFGLLVVGSFIFYNVMENSEEEVKHRAEIELQKQRQAQQERIARGMAACNRAANPPPGGPRPSRREGVRREYNADLRHYVRRYGGFSPSASD